METFLPKTPACFISTHFDDVVLSCTNFLEHHSGSTVITVLGGAPHRQTHDVNSEYTGKAYAPDAVNVRKDENTAAMKRLHEHAVTLNFWDAIYLHGIPQDEPAIAKALASAIHKCKAKAVIAPIGLRHPDHVAVANACRFLVKELDLDFYFYLDLPYGPAFPELLKARLRELERQGINVEELNPVSTDEHSKDTVFKLYKSQYAPTKDDFNENNDLAYNKALQLPERYWQVLRT